jgi:hypothetical protein
MNFFLKEKKKTRKVLPRTPDFAATLLLATLFFKTHSYTYQQKVAEFILSLLNILLKCFV